MMSKYWYNRGHRANVTNMTLDHADILFMNKRQTDDSQQNLIMTT